MTRTLTSLFALLLASACNHTEGARLGPELQVYPAGVIVAAHAQVPLADNDVGFARIGGNFTDRRDFGDHDDEEGEGFGGGVGWRRYENTGRTGWLFGVRLDLWKFDIDWRDDNPSRRGNSDTFTLQPAAEVGYAVRLNDYWTVDFSASLGAEINVDTDGEDVGEGAILLLGATALYSF